MLYNFSKTFVVLFTLFYFGTCQLPKFYCSLAWESHEIGKNLPSNLVYVQEETNNNYYDDYQRIIVRSRPDNIGYSVGYASVLDRVGHFSFKKQHYNSVIYDILTNPNKCTLIWVTASLGADFVVKDSNVGVHFIGRVATILSNSTFKVPSFYASGSLELDGDIKTEHIFQNILNRRWEVLTSYSEGFRIKLSNFTFLEDMSKHMKLDFVGIDTIENNSPAVILQTVTHKKRVTHSYSFEESYSYETRWKSANYLGIALGYLGLSGGQTGFEGGGEKYEFNEKVSNSSSNEVVVTRTVTVPPFTSLEACTTVKILEDYKSEYIAQAEYDVRGWDAMNIVDWLNNNPDFEWNDVYVVDGKALRFVEGFLDVKSVTLETEFIIVSKNSGKCSELQSKSRSKF